jgi:hemolysin III
VILSKIKDPVSSLTHFIAALLSIAGLVLLICSSVFNATVWHVVTFSIFGASLILLYTASSVYHFLNISEKITKILRKVDHMMIFILIAGTYTPICLIPLRGPWGWSLFGSIWGLALIGIFIKMFYNNLPRWISTIIYILMGWLVIIAIYPLIKTVPVPAVLWLVSGGIIYTLGALIYGLKWPKFNSKIFGFHEIFHLFVMGGSFCHYWLMYRYVIYL